MTSGPLDQFRLCGTIPLLPLSKETLSVALQSVWKKSVKLWKYPPDLLKSDCRSLMFTSAKVLSKFLHRARTVDFVLIHTWKSHQEGIFLQPIRTGATITGTKTPFSGPVTSRLQLTKHSSSHSAANNIKGPWYKQYYPHNKYEYPDFWLLDLICADACDTFSSLKDIIQLLCRSTSETLLLPCFCFVFLPAQVFSSYWKTG